MTQAKRVQLLEWRNQTSRRCLSEENFTGCDVMVDGERCFSDHRHGSRWDGRAVEDGTCNDDLCQCDMLRK